MSGCQLIMFCTGNAFNRTQCKLYISVEDWGELWGKTKYHKCSSDQSLQSRPKKPNRVKLEFWLDSSGNLEPSHLRLHKDPACCQPLVSSSQAARDHWTWEEEGGGGGRPSPGLTDSPSLITSHLSSLSSSAASQCVVTGSVWGWGRHWPPTSPLSLRCKINPSWCSLLAVAWCLLTAWLGLPSLTDWSMRTGQHSQGGEC